MKILHIYAILIFLFLPFIAKGEVTGRIVDESAQPYYRSRNINENGHFNLCPIQKDLSILADCLILSLDKSKIKYNSQISAL